MDSGPLSPDPVQTYQAELEARNERQFAEDQEAKAHADKRTSPAKGTKTCLIKQSTSAHRTAQLRSAMGSALVRFPSLARSQSSNIHFRIERGGGVGVAVSESTYPGMNSYFLIGSQRFSAESDHYADVTAALPALRKESIIKYTWQEWPYRNEINNEDVFAGFSASYDDCLRFLRAN